MADRPLTLKESRFVRAYVGEANGVVKDAALMAGYSAKKARDIGSQTLARPVVRAEVARLESKRPQSLQVWTADYQATVRRQIADQWLAWTMDDATDMTHRVRCSDMLAKHLGMYAEREKSSALAAGIDPAELSDAQLASIAAGSLYELDERRHKGKGGGGEVGELRSEALDDRLTDAPPEPTEPI